MSIESYVGIAFIFLVYVWLILAVDQSNPPVDFPEPFRYNKDRPP